MSLNYKIIQIEGDKPGLSQSIGPFAMNREVIKEFDGYPITTGSDMLWFVVVKKLDVIAFSAIKKFKNHVEFTYDYVVPEYRKKGLHNQLMIARAEWCVQNNVKLIRADCTRASLPGYLKHGFSVVKEFEKWTKAEKKL